MGNWASKLKGRSETARNVQVSKTLAIADETAAMARAPSHQSERRAQVGIAANIRLYVSRQTSASLNRSSRIQPAICVTVDEDGVILYV